MDDPAAEEPRETHHMDPRAEQIELTRRRTLLYAAGWFLFSLTMPAAAGWGALDWAAALGKGTTGSLRIDVCDMRSGARGGEERVCLGAFRSDTGRFDEHAEVTSNSPVGESIPVTRTLLGEYIQQDTWFAAGAAFRTLIFVTVCAGCGAMGGRYVRRLLR